MSITNVTSGDVALLSDGRLILVEKQTGKTVKGKAFAAPRAPGPIVESGEPVSVQADQISLVSDLHVAWVSPARFAVETNGVEEEILRQTALRAVQRLGVGAKAVITNAINMATVVAFGADGQCISLAYAKKQPPSVVIKELTDVSSVEPADAPSPPAPDAVMEDWINTGRVGGPSGKYSESGLLGQLYDEMKDETNHRRDGERRWFDLGARKPIIDRIRLWSALPWIQAAEVQALSLNAKLGHQRTTEANPIERLEQFSFLFQPDAAIQTALEIVSSFEDYLFDIDIEIESDLNAPEAASVAGVGAHRIGFAQFSLPSSHPSINNLIERFLVTTASHGFLEVEDPLTLDSITSDLDALMDSRSKNSLVVIDGPGGSGKTTRLMHIAAAEAAEGRKVAFIVCSVSLKNRLRRLQRRIPGSGSFRKHFPILSADAVTLGDINDLNRTAASRSASAGMYQPGGGLGLSGESTLEPALHAGLIGAKRSFLIAAHQIKINVGMERSEFETIVIDEAQDLYPQHWLLALSLLAGNTSSTKEDLQVEIAKNAKLLIAFDERQNILERSSILDPLIIQLRENGGIKVETKREKLKVYALSFREAVALASAIDARFGEGMDAKWVRVKQVVRQTAALADHASQVIQTFELSHPGLYDGIWGGLGLSSKTDRVEDPINVLNPSDLEDLVRSIERQDRQSKQDGTLQLAVALPDSWAKQTSGQWFLGDLTLRLLAAGLLKARTPHLAIGSASTILRKAAITTDATGVRGDDFSHQLTECGRLEFLVMKNNKRGSSSFAYKKVLSRVANEAILLKQNGPTNIILADSYTLKGFEFGTLMDMTGDGGEGSVKKTYTLATRPRWRLVSGSVEEVQIPQQTGYSALCKALVNAFQSDIIPFISRIGLMDLQRGESSAGEMAALVAQFTDSHKRSGLPSAHDPAPDANSRHTQDARDR